jgi:protein arginine kinase activator
MLCQHCQKRIANVHFTQIINNNKIEMYLCENCAREKGQMNVGGPLSISDFLGGLIGVGHTNPFTQNPEADRSVCDKCGMTYEEFQRIGKFGCSNCYELFGDRIQPLLKRLHGNVEHNGKIPANVAKEISSSKEISSLKELLNKAIQNEEYEKAAEIRDKIKNIEASNK